MVTDPLVSSDQPGAIVAPAWGTTSLDEIGDVCNDTQPTQPYAFDNGQADAVKLGIARALMQFNAELRKKLKAEGMVSRDSRGKERKKYGQKGARKRFQFSKR